MTNEFGAIYDLCYFIMKSFIDNPQAIRTSLMGSCLSTLYAFLSWIPLGYIFMTELIDMIIQLLEIKEYRIIAMKCLTEIGTLDLGNPTEEETNQMRIKLFNMYTNFLFKLNSIIPSDIPLLMERQKLEKLKSPQLVMFDNVCQVYLFYHNIILIHK